MIGFVRFDGKRGDFGHCEMRLKSFKGAERFVELSYSKEECKEISVVLRVIRTHGFEVFFDEWSESVYLMV